MKLKFAKRMSYIKASEIREILKVTEREDVISFAGGLPAPELFPIDEINKMNQGPPSYLWVRVMTMWIYSSLTRLVSKRCLFRKN